MKRLLFFIIFSSSLVSSQIIKDTIFGRPKYVKEYVLFLNDSAPFTLMFTDNLDESTYHIRRTLKTVYLGSTFPLEMVFTK